MGRKGNARMLERVFLFVAQAGEKRTDEIYNYYTDTYGNAPRPANMTQALLSSGLFKRVGWFDRSKDEMFRTPLSSKDLGLNSRRWICVVDVRPLDEVIESYLSGKKTLRVLEKMPSFVRDAVKEASE